MYHSCSFLSKSEGILYLPVNFIQFICISSNISYPYFKCSFILRVLSKSEWLIFFPSIHFCATTSQLHGFPVISISLSWWSQRSLWCFRIWYISLKENVIHVTQININLFANSIFVDSSHQGKPLAKTSQSFSLEIFKKYIGVHPSLAHNLYMFLRSLQKICLNSIYPARARPKWPARWER